MKVIGKYDCGVMISNKNGERKEEKEAKLTDGENVRKAKLSKC